MKDIHIVFMNKMAEGGFDDYEMREREQEDVREQEREREEREQEDNQETSFDNDDPVVIIRLREHIRVHTDDIPNIGKDVGSIRRSITSDVKKSLRNMFGTVIEKKNGPNSSKVLDYTRFVTETTGSVFIEYRGKRIGRVGRNLKPELYVRRNKTSTDEFRRDLDNAIKESQKTPGALVEESFGSKLSEDVVDSILQGSSERISETLNNADIDITNTSLTEQDLREFAGIRNPKGATPQGKIDALEIQADHWKEESQKSKDPRTKELYKSLESAARLSADNTRLRNNERPIHDEAVGIIDSETRENDLGRLERFRRWARQNLVGLSAIAITIAGIITTVVVAGRGALKKTVKATSALAKALVNIGKKLGPLIAPILNLMAQAISWGANGVEFLSRNLWMLAVGFAWILYNTYKKS